MQVPYRFQAFLSIWDDMKGPCELEQLICLTGQLVAVNGIIQQWARCFAQSAHQCLLYLVTASLSRGGCSLTLLIFIVHQ